MTREYPENDYRLYLMHSAKGQSWPTHKYIAKINGRYIYPEKSSTVKAVTSDASTFRERFEAALATDLKNSAKKQWEARTSNSIPDHIAQKKGIKKRSKIARYLSRKKFGGKTTVRRGRGGIYSGSSRKF